MLLNNVKESKVIDSKEILHNIEESIIKLNKILDKSDLSIGEISDIRAISKFYARAMDSNLLLTDIINEVRGMLKGIDVYSDIGKKIIKDIEDMFSSRLEAVGNEVKGLSTKIDNVEYHTINSSDDKNKIDNVEELEEDISFGNR